ncbi:hypothetical protein [Pseudomonas sp. GM60]|uniref:hypothetical protein n=1 Tax=Pseudomonas sp. GM60 TaxID=1144334 RepID=UPI0002708EBE|nr:hypothetical protein [Pseudomonas sp. GM60]EJM74036.1 hypothetical protein PMI32_05531 [Pseudomonas sp. GM60]
MNNEIQAKLDQFKQFVVIHPEYAEAMDCISRSIEATMMRGEPASALLTGEPGTGKSTASKIALSLLGEKRIITTEAGTTEIVPAFYCSLDAGATIKSLTTTMLQKLGSDNVTGNSSAIFNQMPRGVLGFFASKLRSYKGRCVAVDFLVCLKEWVQPGSPPAINTLPHSRTRAHHEIRPRLLPQPRRQVVDL